MDLYTLDNKFRKDKVIDKFDSVIWTERYAKSGDVNLVVNPTATMRSILTEGTFLALDGTKEVMLLETALVEDGKLKVTGNTLDLFLNQRVIRIITPAGRHMMIYVPPTAQSVERQMNTIVERQIVAGGDLTISAIGIDGESQIIPGLSVDRSAEEGQPSANPISFPFGPMYDAFAQIAETFSTGFTLYLDSADEDSYSLKFKAYRGKDRTSTQSENAYVRFAPSMGSLRDLSQLRSIANYKNAAYVFPPASLLEGDHPMPNEPGIAYGDGHIMGGDIYVEGDSRGFDLRISVTEATDITADDIGGADTPNQYTLANLLEQRARDVIANNNYVKVIDGEVVPQSDYIFGVNYGLGDIIELDSETGDIQKARITEYIRSQDNTGERAYPTISVL